MLPSRFLLFSAFALTSMGVTAQHDTSSDCGNALRHKDAAHWLVIESCMQTPRGTFTAADTCRGEQVPASLAVWLRQPGQDNATGKLETGFAVTTGPVALVAGKHHVPSDAFAGQTIPLLYTIDTEYAGKAIHHSAEFFTATREIAGCYEPYTPPVALDRNGQDLTNSVIMVSVPAPR
ncbi:MAG TPA: hypothetical protein VGF14_08320 [Alphaproteobacteria bacterium]